MSLLGTWVDHIIIIQAVANTNNLRINTTESALNFSESTIVRTVQNEPAERDIYIGHLDELHYVSTTPMTQSVCGQISSKSTNKTFSKDITQIKKLEKRKEYMKKVYGRKKER